MPPQSAREPLVRTQGLCVRFGATRALDGLDLEVAAGRVHAVVGENGAGKSTLLRVLAGTLRPTGGRLVLLGRERAPQTPREAEAWGVGFAPQEIQVCQGLRVAEQVTLGREPVARLGCLDRAAQRRRARALLSRVAAEIDPDAPVEALSADARKRVQIARALAGDPRLLLLDEPSAALDAGGAAAIGRLLREQAAAGGTAVLVSHRLEEVLAFADDVSVLRDGRCVASEAAAALDAAGLVRRMVGRELPGRSAPAARAAGELLLDWCGRVPLRVRRGEIVGLAGLVGAGRSETLEAIARARRGTAALVPEERARKGLVPSFGLRENLFLPAPSAWLRVARERRLARGWVERLAIRAPHVDAPIQTLSGGNQQKLLLARALAREPALVLLDEPTQGVDVAAKREIHQRIRELAAAGAGVVLASSDLPELIGLADRILVLRHGGLAGELPAGASEAEVVALAAGVA